MRHGISIPPFTDAATVIRWATTAEEAGWDGVFLWDHVQWDGRRPVLDPWVVLGAVAARTERVLLGPLVTPLSRRRPHVVAKQLVTLDHLSGGRAVLGVGLGEPVDLDFTDLGEEGDARVRAAMLDEALEVVDGLLRGPVAHHGVHYDVEASFLPLPVQRPRPPIWVAGVVPNRRPLARARRWDGVMPIGADGDSTPAELAAHLASVDGAVPEGWEIVASVPAGVPAQEYADVGATWAIRSAWPPDEGWERGLNDLIAAGP